MARPSNEDKAKKARDTLIETIAKIADLEPTLGQKWRQGMLNYYVARLAELVLYQIGGTLPTKEAQDCVVEHLNQVLWAAPEGST